MTIFNLGSINIDHIYRMEHLPRPGETLMAAEVSSVLGGKGANQSIAAARAGADIRHIGAVGALDGWTLETLVAAGVDTTHTLSLPGPSGHAVIYVDAAAENTIVLFGGANQQIAQDQIDAALAKAKPGDWFLLQNETNLGTHAAAKAAALGLKVCYSAAPFDPGAVRGVLPFTDLLIVNEIEERSIREAMPDLSARLDQIAVVTTLGRKGARYADPRQRLEVAAYAVDAVDSTGAGDTFLGYLLAAIDAGAGIEVALKRASAAAAIKVSRRGTSSGIPNQTEVAAFQKDHA